jgi:hypothetical protein
MTKNEEAITQPKNMSLESVLKVMTALITAGGFIFGIITFQAQQKNIQTESFKMKLWEKKLNVYSTLSDIAGNIIVFRNDSLALDSLGDEFDKIYYSSLILIDDSSVEKSIRLYKDDLSDYRREFISIIELKKSQIRLMRSFGRSLKQLQDFGNER